MTSSAPTASAAKARQQRAQVLARLRHPNLVRMLPLPAGGGLVPVVTEARRLADFTLPAGTFKRFDLEQVVRLMLDVASGLGALHVAALEEPFVHGEVCPRYVYVGEHGTAKLVPLTSAHLNGTRPEPNGYMAPELLLGERADARADVFSVGVMLWEALAGRRLFPDPSPAAVLAVLARPLPQLVLPQRVAWAQSLCPVVRRALSRHPGARYASALELSQAITKAVGPHLASAGGANWQDEAPTPVLKPRLHFAPLRSATPPATTLDLTPLAATSSAPPASADVQLVTDASAIATGKPARRRAWPLALGALLVVVAAGWTLRDGARLLPSSRPATAATPISAPALAPEPSAAPGPTLRATASTPAAPAPAPVASVAPVPSAAPAASAAPASSALPPSAAPASRAPKRPRPVSRPAAPKAADYGI